jgi:hypothetical protein
VQRVSAEKKQSSLQVCDVMLKLARLDVIEGRAGYENTELVTKKKNFE